MKHPWFRELREQDKAAHALQTQYQGSLAVSSGRVPKMADSLSQYSKNSDGNIESKNKTQKKLYDLKQGHHDT